MSEPRRVEQRWVAATHAVSLAERFARGEEASAVLVLTRKANESIMIGDEIEVSILAITREKVRIGIEAPRAIPLFRKELYVEMQRERAQEDDPAKVDEALDRLESSE